MNFKKLMKDILPHAAAILVFLLVAYIYFIRTFQGYMHKEEDVTQGLLKGTEIQKYTDKDGDFPAWTNSIFSGMPSVLIQGKRSANLLKDANYLTLVNHTAYPFKILFLSFIGFYILMHAFKIKPLFGILASLAYGFATYSLSSIEAAHYTKVLAMALIPALMGSLHLIFTGRYFSGAVTLAFNFGLQIYFFHFQITLYSIICLVVLGIYYIFHLSKEKQFKQLFIGILISTLAVGMGVMSNLTKLKTTSEFAKNTMRGGNDMAKANPNVKQKESGKSGLDRDYAFSWSYGIGETFTLLIPSFYGGSSQEKINKKSKFYETTQNDEAIEQGLPMYHGDLQFTSGPIYIGSIIIFLFVLGMIVIKSPIKWALFALTLISFILGWGKHFSGINYWLFDNLPYYNKFRTPMMAFSIAQVTIPLIGFLGLKELYDNWDTKQKNGSFSIDWANIWKSKNPWENIVFSFIIVGGFCLIMAIMGSSFVDMGGLVDNDLKANNASLIPILKEDRASLLSGDAFRSFIFITIAFAMFWALYNKKIQSHIAIAIIGIFATIDLIGVDWRYLNWADFQFEKGTATDRIPDEADKQILADKDPHFRVFDLTNDPFNNNEGAAFHKMIGGYDPAKLSRYQDLISEFLSKKELQDQGLDFLNCKYLIGAAENKKIVVPRNTANGNAWFVNELIFTKDASDEMDVLKTIDNKNKASYNASFEQNKDINNKIFIKDSFANIKLTNYHPDTLLYVSDNKNDGYAVFSEIFYDNWKAEVDGKPIAINKVDYTLRGIMVPQGKHSIKLYFNKGEGNTDTIEKFASLTILILMGGLIITWIWGYRNKA